MQRKKNNVPLTTVTRDLDTFREKTGNLYKSLVIMGKRANQLAMEMKDDLEHKLQEFSSYNDGIEDGEQNNEQIEISKFYEKLPKPVLVSAKEFENDEIYWRDPLSELEDDTEDDEL